MKIAADQTNAEREKAQIEATLQIRRETAEANQKREQDLIKMKADADESTKKREQLFMEHELKRQKMIVEAHSAVQQERLKADMNREIASLEVFERRELEFQQAQEKRGNGQSLPSKNCEKSLRRNYRSESSSKEN